MTQPLDQHTHVSPSPSVYARAFGAEIVLLDFGKGEYFGLDEVGADIWRRLEAGDDIGAAADHLAAHYAVDRDEALRDIVDLVSELRSYGLVEAASGANANPK